MSSNTENTEAKLAAYIDGQLDPAERAQIEQYLQSNPEHRKLLADLIAQRETLRSLPREKAPPDVYDAIQAQLERSVLLDDSASSAAPVIRHSRRSQLFGLAAMLLLAVGLGVVLYFALPSTRPHAIDVASTAGPSAASQPTTSATDADLDVDLLADNAVTTAKRHAKSTPASAAKRARPEEVATASNPSPLGQSLQSLHATTSPQLRTLAKATAEPSPAAQPAHQVILLVSTDDPSKVNQQVESYLQSNHIRWDAVRTPADQVFFGRTPAPAAAAPVPAPKQESAPAAESNFGTPAPTTDESKSTQAPPAAPAPDESQPASPDQQPQPTSSPNPPETLAQELPSPTTQPQAATTSASPAEAAPRPSYIVARGMTRDQAIALTDALSTDRSRQRARLIGQLPTQPPTRKPLQLHDDESNRPQPTPQTQPTTEPSATTQPTTDLATEEPTTAPILAEKLAPLPTTLPTTLPTSRPAAPTVDVVILVEDDSPFPTTAPTTQPAPEQ